MSTPAAELIADLTRTRKPPVRNRPLTAEWLSAQLELAKAQAELREFRARAWAGAVAICEEQEIFLRELAESVSADLPKFLAYMKAGSLAAIAAKDYHKAEAALKAKAKAGK